MCEEYDDERMKVFWRVLDERHKLEMVEPASEETEQPIVKPLTELGEAQKQKHRALVR